ncbi:universal stress protein [Natrinema ejinorense]|uniref:Universal stress protein n=1 Tax=Natrinema ejinorense TaxID=373386 RepID=A0A2A5QQ10_9EURY|nr:universal stress protein [Natrinema ejinorense]PCR88823.1 universal stress protein [Natrinema ejinorense]
MSVDTILVAVRDVDDQTPLLDAVVDVATPTDASIVLARAYDEEEFEKRVDELDFDGSPSTDEVARRSQSVRDAARVLQDADIEHTVRGVVGEAGTAFVELADVLDPDLLYVQGKGRNPTGKALFGSTAQTVLLNAPCPVTFVRS